MGIIRITLLLHNDLYSNELALVGEHIDESGMRDLDKVLVVFFAHG